ncbi:periplasmic binding protein-like II [Anaeromyces robustus]|uniref:Periplasmic binding protein-like II n=1 Tax=Anaeromyces robustus TaxID=1754192 RepID=A0A1Y1WUY1_9FUNG|nr:periplasmic binding protein-like II [Anaeromyces robustus]|eukprot:ORX77361.1 periplasmic binding protein-like II [Anaeromyces robustus]
MLIIKLAFLIFSFINFGKAIHLTAITFSQNGGSSTYSPMVDEFNVYAKENNLNITLNLVLFSKANATSDVKDYETMLESLFFKKSKKYDLIFYDNVYSIRFGPYLLNLNDYIPKDHINMYTEGIASKSCVYKNSLVALPVNIDATFFYSNPTYLNKYNQAVPKTWDEMLEIGKYIFNEEKKNNNTDFVAYNGLFSASEIGTCSLYEFIYSYRNSVNDTFPDITSKESIKAIEMIKTIKEEMSSDEVFQSFELYSAGKFAEGNFLFMKFWYYAFLNDRYILSGLPGSKPGISGSVVGGYNLGINKFISETSRDAAVIAFQFMTSKNMQKRFVLKNNIISPIPSLYFDDDVCQYLDCELFKNIQLTVRPNDKASDYSNYSENFRNKIYEYLYGEKSAHEVLQEIDDITKIYYFSINNENSLGGKIYFIINIIISVIMVLLTGFLFIEKYKKYFEFESKMFYYIIILGILLITWNPFTKLGKVESYKCNLQSILLNYGYTLIIIPILYKLIINFPETNKISLWIKDKKMIFLSIFLVIDTLLITIYILSSPYTIEKETINGKNYNTCQLTNLFSIIIFYIMIIYQILLFLTIIILIFIEWNISETYYDVRFIMSSISVDILLVTIIFILQYMRKSNYVVYFSIYSWIFFIFGLSNYIFLYAIKIFCALIKLENEEELIIQDIKYKFQTTTSDSKFSGNGSTSLTSSLNKPDSHVSIPQKLLNYHFRSSIVNSQNILYSPSATGSGSVCVTETLNSN